MSDPRPVDAGPRHIDHLWAGWRREYVETVTQGPQPDCALCGAIDPDGSQSRWLIHRDDLVAVMLNAYPYTNGHVLVLPVRHEPELGGLSDAESAALWRRVTDAVAAVGEAYRPDGMNIGANLGSAAGAGVPSHVHLHVLPRWAADTSFTTAVAGLRVLPESLDDSAERIRAAWRAG